MFENTRRWPAVLIMRLGLAFASLWTSGLGLAQTYSYTKIVDDGTPRPDGKGNFVLNTNFLYPPALDGSWVVFIAAGPGNSGLEIWSYNMAAAPGQQFTKLVDFSTPVPGSAGGGTFADFTLCGTVYYPIQLHDGNVLFYGADSSAPICNFGHEGGIYTVPVSGGTVSRVVDYSTALPGSTGTFHTGVNPEGNSLSQGEVVFPATASDGDKGVWAATVNGSGLERIADDNTVYNCPQGSHGGCPNLYSSPFIHAGNTVFVGSGTFGEEGWNAVFATSVNSPTLNAILTSAFALPGDPGPDSPVIPDVKGFYSYPVIDGNNIFFIATDPNFAGSCAGGTTFTGVYQSTLSGGSATKVADTCDMLPGLGALNGANSFNSLSAGSGTVAFQVEGTNGTQAIYAQANGTLTRVIGNGDSLLGSTVYQVVGYLGNNAVSQGSILFQAVLNVPGPTFGGIYLATLLGPPSVNTGGVVTASAFGEFAAAAPGSWIEIYGSNLAVDTRPWQLSDFKGINAPTSLDGTSVTIGGVSAYVSYISPTQVNVQVPNVAAGTQPLIIQTPAGSSPAYDLAVEPVEPGLLAPSSFKINGVQYAWALDGNSYVLPTGAISGLTSAPAKPGDVIVLYGVGFGPVSPAIPEGQIVQQLNGLPSFDISIGGAPATVQYAGLAPNFVGLYQFNVVVPSIASNTAAPVTFSVSGTAGTQTLYLAVQ
jgi:uncharacterized protein (TIGR03437 family)